MGLVRLPITLMCQEQTEWCWAAVVSAISASDPRAQPRAQCEVVAAVMAAPDSCDRPSDHNRQGTIPDGLAVVGLSARHVTSGLLEFPTIVTAIQDDRRPRPVGARIEDRLNGLAHNVLIVGCDDSDGTVLVSDPWGTPATAAATWSMAFLDFKTAYGEDGWGRCTDVFVID